VRRAPLFKYPDGAWRNAAAIGYATLGHAAAVGLLIGGGAVGRLIGVALAAHTLVIATYLVHECIHETIFRDRAWNARLGAAMAWLGDGGLAGYARLRRKHLHHHLDRVDPVAFDYRAWLAAHPLLRRAVLGLEWAHVPAVELLMRVVPLWRAARQPADRGERRRVLTVLATRIAAALLLGLVAPFGLALYGLAYLLFIVAARFADAFHHTFELVVVDHYDYAFGPPPGFDRDYEHANTYSNVLSRRWPVLNLMLLNFSYHNAHHIKPGVPWHRLPALDASLFGAAADAQCVPLGRLLADFHAFRMARLSSDQAIVHAADGTPRFIGAVAVSLLTL
jgi:fatty acid desaturase